MTMQAGRQWWCNICKRELELTHKVRGCIRCERVVETNELRMLPSVTSLQSKNDISAFSTPLVCKDLHTLQSRIQVWCRMT
jgi:hypothetical protein